MHFFAQSFGYEILRTADNIKFKTFTYEIFKLSFISRKFDRSNESTCVHTRLYSIRSVVGTAVRGYVLDFFTGRLSDVAIVGIYSRHHTPSKL